MNNPSNYCFLFGVLSGIAQLISLIVFGVTNAGLETQKAAIYLPYMPIMFLANFLTVRKNEAALLPAISGAAIFWMLIMVSTFWTGRTNNPGAHNLLSGIGLFLSFSIPVVLGQYLGYLAGNKARARRIQQ